MSWFKDGLKFECTRCGKCCTGKPGYVWIQNQDMHRIAEFLGIRFRDFAAQYARKVGGEWSLIEKPNGDCIFYDSGCKIYPVRPTQCRTFPFWKENLKSPGTWKSAAKECEGIDQGRTYSMEEIDAFFGRRSFWHLVLHCFRSLRSHKNNHLLFDGEKAAQAAKISDPEQATRAYLDSVPQERRQKTKAYAHGNYILDVVDFVYTSLVLIGLMAFRVSARMREIAQK